MVARFIGGSLEGTAKRRGNPGMRMRNLDADHFSILAEVRPVLWVLTVHVQQTSDMSAGFNRFGDRAEMAMK